MFVVDTNVLGYAANRAAPERARCSSLLDRWRERSEPWFLTWGVVYEFLRLSTHPRLYPEPLTIAEAFGFVATLLESPSVEMLSPSVRHLEVFGELIDESPDLRGNDIFDLRTAVLMREHGVTRIVTRDRGFSRFPFLQVIDPLTGEP